ncbi:hypothetical protein WN55_06243 [Dufourea novaeangliae]|uniref:Reverse transcriptase zinc-binding domain-containing protein n=1 Tax=Dufourea novaeangliae TaxID=178035 RepID=A0A154PRD0_DUFNO|nr:hypothetical protein WN55_06243 [Dufourea novaeangliae]
MYKVPHTDFKETYKQKMWQDFQIFLQQEFQSKGTLYSIYYEARKKPWFHSLDLPREFIVRFTRIRSNHYNAAASLARTGIKLDPQCECSYPYQDFNHLLWNCPKFSDHRKTLLHKLRETNWTPPYCITTFLKGPNIGVLRIINAFCEAYNIKL